MGKKAKIIGKNIRKALMTSPKMFIQEVAEDYEGLEYTLARTTYIMEQLKATPLKIDVKKGGRSIISGTLVWVGEDPTGGGIEFYLDNKKHLYPNADNVKGAFFHSQGKGGGGYVEITVHDTSIRCLICGKEIEIFDEPASCPVCGAKSHLVHLLEWVRMKGECSACSARLGVGESGDVIAFD
ncbi:MAG: hypothetical protein ACFFCS_16070 [Candidatus Hodarchaeota archaeon]